MFLEVKTERGINKERSVLLHKTERRKVKRERRSAFFLFFSFFRTEEFASQGKVKYL